MSFVASGMADVGYGVETPARQFKLDFIPSQIERYFLLCDQKSIASAPMQKLISILRSDEYRRNFGRDRYRAYRGYR